MGECTRLCTKTYGCKAVAYDAGSRTCEMGPLPNLPSDADPNGKSVFMCELNNVQVLFSQSVIHIWGILKRWNFPWLPLCTSHLRRLPAHWEKVLQALGNKCGPLCCCGAVWGSWRETGTFLILIKVCELFNFFHILLLLQNFRPSSKTERISRQFTQYQVKTCGSKGHIICKIVVLAVQMGLPTTSTTGSVPP